jgi:hypothetical protein
MTESIVEFITLFNYWYYINMATPKQGLTAGCLLLICLSIVGCTTVRQTEPDQTAREQLRLSRAADLASAKIHPNLPKGNAIYIDTSYFPDNDDYRTHYAIARIRAQLLEDGYRLVDSADDADTIAEISSGALSIDHEDTLFGLPSTPIPIPLTGTVHTPEIALYKKRRYTGIAKFNIAFYNAKSGSLQGVKGPIYGFSHDDNAAILGIGWKHQNLLPPAVADEMKGKTDTTEETNDQTRE